MKELWALEDIIDVEILVQEDAASEDLDRLRQRDRAIYKRFAKENGPLPGRQDCRRLFRYWLDVRHKERGGSSIGKEILSAISLARAGLFVLGAVMASAAVATFFRGFEQSAARPEPVNVLWYGLACIGLPFLVALYGGWILLGQRALPRLPAAPPFLRGTIFNLLRPLFEHSVRRLEENIGAERQLNARAVIGTLRQRIESRKSVLAAKFFHTIQALGLGFTLGILFFSWIDHEFYSRVFGWQTTDRNLTPSAVYGTVSALADPWRWARGDGVGFPTLDEVRETNFVRFHDPGAFPAEAAPAWAAFLIWAALVYGFLPRLLIERVTAHHVQTALDAEDFHELRFDPLWERMTLERGGFNTSPPDPLSPVEDGESSNSVSSLSSAGGLLCRILIPAELNGKPRTIAIRNWLEERKGWEVVPVAMELLPGIPEKNKLLKDLRASAVNGGNGSWMKILLVQESFMPPTQEYLDFLHSLRSAIGVKNTILIGLIGKPDGTPLAQPPDRIDAGVWKKRIASLGDPNMEILCFLP